MAEPLTHQERAERAQSALLGLSVAASIQDERDVIARETLPTELVQAAREFVRKVESGEARSTRSYAAFKAALALYPTEQETP